MVPDHQLESWLRGLQSVEAAQRRCASTLRRVSVLRGSLKALRASSRLARESRLAATAAAVERARCRCARERSAWESRAVAKAEASEAGLARLVLRYGAIVAAERAAATRRAAEAEVECGRARRAVECRRRLSLFAANVDHETRGLVRLRHLPESDAQCARCKRAARENVRRNFFATESVVEVVDVYKIENRLASDAFRAAASETKVKGLFCTVPDSCAERITCLGLRAADEASAMERALFEDEWIARRAASSDAVDGPARQACRCAPPTFPRPFSRYSTALDAADRDDTERLRFLALCRVLVGRVRVGETAGECDSTYAPSTDEYTPLRADRVLPEFLLVYRFASARPRQVDLEGCALTRLALDNVDLGVDVGDDGRCRKHADVVNAVASSEHHLALGGLRRAADVARQDRPSLHWDMLLDTAGAERQALLRAVSDIVAAVAARTSAAARQNESAKGLASANALRTSRSGRSSRSSTGSRPSRRQARAESLSRRPPPATTEPGE